MLRLSIPAVLGLLGVVHATRPADPPAADVDRIFARYDRTTSPGCALGVFRNDSIIYSRGYGMADLNQGVPITPRTVFYIASTSKQFTALAIAMLEEEGKLSVDDPVRKWVPELPAYADSIRVSNLVHHTSGIRDILGLWALSGRSYADEIPVEAGLDLIFRQKALDFPPGSRYSYSNSGYVLLAEIVRRASGKTLREFTTERVFGPLGMDDTHFHDDNGMIVPRRAEGYAPAGPNRFRIVKTSFDLVGDGGLFTTIEDLAKYDRNFYANRLGAGGQRLIDRITTRGKLSSGQQLTYAFGLTVDTVRGLPVVQHGGAFIGFRAQMLRYPGEHFTVAVLCNEATAPAEQLAQQVADLYLADRLAPRPSTSAAAGATVAPEILDRWVGNYRIGPGTVARITRDGNDLFFTGFGPRARLTPQSDSVFVPASFPFTFRFSSGKDGPRVLVDGMGMTEPVGRLAATPRLTPAQLAQYAGRFQSAELDTWAVVEASGDSLRIRTRWGPWQRLEPLAPDVFLSGGIELTFDRDRSRRVTGFRLSAARTLGVGFERVGR